MKLIWYSWMGAAIFCWGWIHQHCCHAILVYTDPVHGYKFRSKEEVLCYLQTGDASRCARRPVKRNVALTTKDDSDTMKI
ncbi:hypothetical protein P3S68_014899 [Capsicum galapagoense]